MNKKPVDNQLDALIKENTLEQTKVQYLLGNFNSYFKMVAEWEIIEREIQDKKLEKERKKVEVTKEKIRKQKDKELKEKKKHDEILKNQIKCPFCKRTFSLNNKEI